MILDLSTELRPKTLATLTRFGDEFNLDPSEPRDLALLIEIMKGVKDASYNFPNGKYDTIVACQTIVANYARKLCAVYYNGRV